MKGGATSVVVLAVGCAVAAAIFGFGATVFGFRSAVAGDEARLTIMQLARLGVFLTLGVLLALKGGWRGVFLAIGMVLLATFVDWLLLPFALSFASISDPASFAERYAGFRKPTYGEYATFDVIGVAVTAALAWGLKLMAHVDPTSTPRDE